jgi:hypothetical protein
MTATELTVETGLDTVAASSGVDLRLVGSHAGVKIGADGPSQLALEDLAMMRAVHGSTGSGAELLAWAGIDADHIAAAARRLIGNV